MSLDSIFFLQMLSINKHRSNRERLKSVIY